MEKLMALAASAGAPGRRAAGKANSLPLADCEPCGLRHSRESHLDEERSGSGWDVACARSSVRLELLARGNRHTPRTRIDLPFTQPPQENKTLQENADIGLLPFSSLFSAFKQPLRRWGALIE